MNEKGMSLIEVLVTASVLAMVLGALALPFRGGRESWETGDRHAEVMQNALIGMDKITRELKQAQHIVNVSYPPANPSNPTTSEKRGFIEYTDINGIDKRFQFTLIGEGSLGYLEHGPVGDPTPIAGPIERLIFTCYQEDGVVPTTIPHKVGMVKIQTNTCDSQDKVADIPLVSKVRVNSDISGQGGGSTYTPTEYAIYGAAGIDIKNGAIITSPDPINKPANIGALYDLIWSGNNVTVDGDVVTGGALHLDNVSLTCQDVFVNLDVQMDNGSGVSGNVNTNGNAVINGNVGGYINLPPDKTITPANYAGPIASDEAGGVPYKKFLNPLPDPTYTTATFPPLGANIEIPNNGTLSLTPGVYGEILQLDNNATLRLQPGTYWFGSIKTKSPGSSVTLDLNLTPSPGNLDPVVEFGGIQIFVKGDVTLTNLSLSANTKASYTSLYIAKHFYMEILGNWSLGTKNGERWCGTVFTPIQNNPSKGNITLVNADLTGALWAGGWVTLYKPNVSIVYELADDIVLPPHF